MQSSPQKGNTGCFKKFWFTVEFSVCACIYQWTVCMSIELISSSSPCISAQKQKNLCFNKQQWVLVLFLMHQPFREAKKLHSLRVENKSNEYTRFLISLTLGIESTQHCINSALHQLNIASKVQPSKQAGKQWNHTLTHSSLIQWSGLT